MAFNIGGINAFLTLDSSGFDRGVDNAGRKLESLQGKVSAGSQAIATGLVAGTAAVATLTVNLGKAGVAYNSMQQNSRAALQTLLGSQKAVNDQMAKLNELASRSPFSKSIFIQGQQQLLAFGYEAEKVIPTLNAVQNAVAATGGSGQQLQDLIFVMAQIRAAGKITGQDLLQMGQRGVNAAELIGDAMGMTAAQVKEAITAGKIDAVAALDAITTGMTRKFGGATDLIKQQWSGAVDRIKAAWRDTGADIARPFVDPNGGGQAVIWANLVADLMRQGQKQVQGLVNVMETRGKPVFQGITKTLQAATAAAARFDLNRVVSQVDRLTKYEPLIKGTGAALLTLGLRPIPVLGALAGGLSPVVAGVAALVASTPELRKAGSEFTTALAPALPQLKAAAVGVADLAMAIINAGAPALTELAKNGGRVLAELSPLAPALVSVLNAGVPVVGMVANLVAAASALPTPLLASVAAMAAFHKIAQAEIWTTLGSKIVGAADSVRLFAMYSRELGVLNAAAQSAGGLLSTIAGLASPAGVATLAVGALAAVVVAFAKDAADSAKRVDDLASSLDEATGAITKNTRAIVYKQLVDNGAIDAAKQLGINLGVVTDAALGNEKAQRVLADRTRELMDAQRAQYDAAAKSGQYTGELASVMDQTAQSVQTLEKGVGTLNTELDQAQSQNKDTAEAMAGLGDSADTVAKAQERLAEATKTATDSIREQAAANGDLVSAQYQTKDTVAELSQAIQESTGVQLDAAGAVDTKSDANRRLVESTQETIRAIHDEMDAFVKAGHTQAEVDERTKALTDSLYAQLEGLGVSREQAAAFAKELGLIPDRKAVTFDFAADAQPALDKVDEVVRTAKGSTGVLTLDARDDPAVQKLAKSLNLVETSTGVYTINANDNPALAQLLASIARVNTSTGVMTIDGNNERAQGVLRQIVNHVTNSTPELRIYGKDYATGVASAIQADINSRVAYIQVRAAYSGENALGGLPMANGGVIEYYAGGGLRERHVAQIAPAGAWRVWAEPETGGEAYIPMAASKRARSQQIMAEVARRFGDLYMPRGAKTYANGSAPSGSAATAGSQTYIFNVTVTNPFTSEEISQRVRGELIGTLQEVGY